jgi:hypothetical protein
MANWIARLIVAAALVLTSGSVIIFAILFSLAALFVRGMALNCVAMHPPETPSQRISGAG